jgi:hypothetical protein
VKRPDRFTVISTAPFFAAVELVAAGRFFGAAGVAAGRAAVGLGATTGGRSL